MQEKNLTMESMKIFLKQGAFKRLLPTSDGGHYKRP